MNAEQFAEKLTELDACSDATAWAAGKTLSQAWKECQKPDWMLWLLGRSTINKKVIATIAVEFAEMSAANASAYPEVAECIAVTKRYLAGEATAEELSAARSAAASAASAARSAAASAASAAESAAASAESAAESAAASAAWYAAASAESAAWSAAASAESAVASAQCDIIRKHVGGEEISSLLK